jgi:hypothetical protein
MSKYTFGRHTVVCGDQFERGVFDDEGKRHIQFDKLTRPNNMGKLNDKQ